MSNATLLELTREIANTSESRFQRATREWLSKINAEDVLNELMIDCQAELDAAMEKDDPALIGRVFLAVKLAYAERLANRCDFGGKLLTVSTQEAAARVVRS